MLLRRGNFDLGPLRVLVVGEQAGVPTGSRGELVGGPELRAGEEGAVYPVDVEEGGEIRTVHLARADFELEA